MRARVMFAGLLGALALAPATWAMNFTLTQETQMIDSYPIRFFSFEDGGKRIGYGPPNGWRCIGSVSQLSLQDPATTQAEATVTSIPREKPGPFTLENRQAFKAAALALVPADGQNVNLVESVGRHPIGNAESYIATVSYGYFGKKYSVRLTYVNLAASFLQILCKAPADKMEAFAGALDSSFYSWYWM